MHNLMALILSNICIFLMLANSIYYSTFKTRISPLFFFIFPSPLFPWCNLRHGHCEMDAPVANSQSKSEV